MAYDTPYRKLSAKDRSTLLNPVNHDARITYFEFLAMLHDVVSVCMSDPDHAVFPVFKQPCDKKTIPSVLKRVGMGGPMVASAVDGSYRNIATAFDIRQEFGTPSPGITLDVVRYHADGYVTDLLGDFFALR